jgi:hypothetical protein
MPEERKAGRHGTASGIAVWGGVNIVSYVAWVAVLLDMSAPQVEPLEHS